jgi:hypothetical protein
MTHLLISEAGAKEKASRALSSVTVLAAWVAALTVSMTG